MREVIYIIINITALAGVELADILHKTAEWLQSTLSLFLIEMNTLLCSF